MSVLTEPKNALVRQYQTLFQMEHCDIEFTEGALKLVAKRALEKGTGARGLRSIVERVMLDIMYELPDQPKGSKFVITEEIVNGNKFQFTMPETKSA